MEKRENKFKKILVTNSSEETEKLGFDFAKKLEIGDVICLYGNLGAGKTQFVKGLAKGLGIKHRIISPTFIIVRSYKVKSEKLKVKNVNKVKIEEFSNFYHADLYRLENENDLESTGLLDILKEKNNIVAIEWPEKLGKFLPEKRWEIKFEILDENKREIIIEQTFNAF